MAGSAGAVGFRHAASQRAEQRTHQDSRYDAFAAGIAPGCRGRKAIHYPGLPAFKRLSFSGMLKRSISSAEKAYSEFLDLSA